MSVGAVAIRSEGPNVTPILLDDTSPAVTQSAAAVSVARSHSSDYPEVLFVDANAPEPETSEATIRPEIELVYLNAEYPALAQIAAALQQPERR